MMAYGPLFSTMTDFFPDYDFASKHDLHAEYSTCF